MLAHGKPGHRGVHQDTERDMAIIRAVDVQGIDVGCGDIGCGDMGRARREIRRDEFRYRHARAVGWDEIGRIGQVRHRAIHDVVHHGARAGEQKAGVGQGVRRIGIGP